MNINIFESFDFVRETPRCGLIESLAVNEASVMLEEGKEYNGDLCLAKAIMFVTITEAMDELGFMHVNEKKYSQIIEAAGGKLDKQNPKLLIKRKKISARAKGKGDDNPRLGTGNSIADRAYQAEERGYYMTAGTPEEKFNTSLDQSQSGHSKHHLKDLKESKTQFAIPVNKNTLDPIAERIRKKRFEEK